MNKEKAAHLQNVTILFDSAWDTYKKHFQTLLKINFLPVIVGMATLAAFGLAGDFTKIGIYLDKADVIGVIGLVLGVSVITVVVSSLNYIAQVVALGNEWTNSAPSAKPNAAPSVFAVYDRASHLLFPYFWIMIMAGLSIFVGFVFFIVPGLVFAVWFAFSSFFLILGNGKANETDAKDDAENQGGGFRGIAALKMSKLYVRGIWSEVLIRLIVAAFLGLLLNIALAIFKSFVADIMHAPMYSASINNFLDFAYTLLVTPYFVVYAYELYMDVMHAHESATGAASADEAVSGMETGASAEELASKGSVE